MFYTIREVIAYGLMAAIVVAVVAWLAVASVRRKRRKLRHRGIKRYGH